MDFFTGDQESFIKFKQNLSKKENMSHFIPNGFRRYPLIRSPKDKDIIYNLFPQFFANQICTILYWELKRNKIQEKENQLKTKEEEGKKFSVIFGDIFQDYCQDLIKYSLQKDLTSKFYDNDEIKNLLMHKFSENDLPKHADGILVENNTAIFFEFKSGAVPEPQRKDEKIFKEIKEGLGQINSIINEIEKMNFQEDILKDVNQIIGIIVGWEEFPFSPIEIESWGNIEKPSFEWMYLSVSVFEIMTSLKRKGWQYKGLFDFLIKCILESHSVGEIRNGPAYLTTPNLIKSLTDQYGNAFNECYTYNDFNRYTEHLINPSST